MTAPPAGSLELPESRPTACVAITGYRALRGPPRRLAGVISALCQQALPMTSALTTTKDISGAVSKRALRWGGTWWNADGARQRLNRMQKSANMDGRNSWEIHGKFIEDITAALDIDNVLPTENFRLQDVVTPNIQL